MARYQLIKRLETLEQLADTQPVDNSRQWELEAAMANDPALAAVLSRVPKGRRAFDLALGKWVRYGPKLGIADIDLDDSETVLLRTEAIRNRLEGNPDA